MGSNLFKDLRIERDEVMMCRFLADLLDPKGGHERGTGFLRSFLEEIVGAKDVEEEGLERTCVMTEYLIDNGRRIDIMLHNPRFSVPIEVKIDARDQQSQCYDYWHYARNAPLVYLTKEGHVPSEWSRKPKEGSEEERQKGMLPEDRIKCVSWEKICGWLEKRSGGLDQVSQYTQAIRSFLPEHGKRQADCALVRDVLEAFRRGMDQGIVERYGLEELDRSYRSYRDWPGQSLSYCPGLNYRVKRVDLPEEGGPRMWFRIEVAGDGYLSAGFCLVDTKTGDKVDAQSIAIEDLRQFDALRSIISRDDWWLVWRFSNGKQDASRGDVPNFKTMDRCAKKKLLDEKGLAAFVEETIQIFEAQLLGYLL